MFWPAKLAISMAGIIPAEGKFMFSLKYMIPAFFKSINTDLIQKFSRINPAYTVKTQLLLIHAYSAEQQVINEYKGCRNKESVEAIQNATMSRKQGS